MCTRLLNEFDHTTFDFAGLVYTIMITEKWDVYSFGVLELEVITGNHPKDFLSTFKSSPSGMNITLHEKLDRQLPPPSIDVESKLIAILEIAF